MRKIELSLASDSVPSWGVVDAVRELFQNAIDQEAQNTSNKAYWDYDDSGVLYICNAKSSLTTKSLLLGSTTKAGDSNTIGQFGEGYKVATLVLLREGKQVTFYNYGAREVWRPRFVKSRRFDVDILTFFIDKEYPWTSVPNNDLTIEIQGITKQEWQELIVPSNLRLRTDYTVMQETEFGQILDIPGKVFVNGLFVCDYKDYKHSYNFKPGHLKLDRDRKLASDFDLKWLASKMWRVTQGNDAMLRITELLAQGASDVHFLADVSYVGSIKQVSQEAHQQFIEEYGSDAVPVSTQYEAMSVPSNYKPVIVNETHKRVIKESPTYSDPEPPVVKKKPFTIICNKCDSANVTIKNMMCEGECEGYEITCSDCGNTTTDNNEEV